MPAAQDIAGQFRQAMLNIYHAARRLEPPYNPTAFLTMVNEHGGKGAADRLLSGSAPSSGFTELFMRGRESLKLSVEYLVLQHPWRQLFTAEQLAVARRRLRDVGCSLPPDDREPVAEYLPLPDELPRDATLTEGAARQVLVNAYERSSAARQRCVAHYGSSCVVCGFDFETTYGPEASGHIHVHHLVPLSRLTGAYEVDPINDLRPVCPNCHAVIHLGGGCRTIEQVRDLIAANRP